MRAGASTGMVRSAPMIAETVMAARRPLPLASTTTDAAVGLWKNAEEVSAHLLRRRIGALDPEPRKVDRGGHQSLLYLAGGVELDAQFVPRPPLPPRAMSQDHRKADPRNEEGKIEQVRAPLERRPKPADERGCRNQHHRQGNRAIAGHRESRPEICADADDVEGSESDRIGGRRRGHGGEGSAAVNVMSMPRSKTAIVAKKTSRKSLIPQMGTTTWPKYGIPNLP